MPFDCSAENVLQFFELLPNISITTIDNTPFDSSKVSALKSASDYLVAGLTVCAALLIFLSNPNIF